MTEIGEYVDWEGGWGGTPSSERSVTKPQPEHDSDTVDILPSNSESADRINPRRVGGVVTRPDRPTDWD
ncbi:MAG: hypothetical protein JWN26_433 [Candidatus Saccharibacteria bacterium]|nr:hypothetical protein [Candidatus Saccharibacteria bacterium]